MNTNTVTVRVHTSYTNMHAMYNMNIFLVYINMYKKIYCTYCIRTFSCTYMYCTQTCKRTCNEHVLKIHLNKYTNNEHAYKSCTRTCPQTYKLNRICTRTKVRSGSTFVDQKNSKVESGFYQMPKISGHCISLNRGVGGAFLGFY